MSGRLWSAKLRAEVGGEELVRPVAGQSKSRVSMVASRSPFLATNNEAMTSRSKVGKICKSVKIRASRILLQMKSSSLVFILQALFGIALEIT